MEPSIVFIPLLKLPTSYGLVTLSKHLAVDIFSYAFSQQKVIALFKILNKNFSQFNVTHKELIEKVTVKSMLELLKMRFIIRN